mmetsp:Transcript_47941/g.145830  ORF Transcript_47941/g.145830 Transcript_47941/m.145830 type:complete len:206 (-) Transcript_47941:158-775(-)
MRTVSVLRKCAGCASTRACPKFVGAGLDSHQLVGSLESSTSPMGLAEYTSSSSMGRRMKICMRCPDLPVCSAWPPYLDTSRLYIWARSRMLSRSCSTWSLGRCSASRISAKDSVYEMSSWLSPVRNITGVDTPGPCETSEHTAGIAAARNSGWWSRRVGKDVWSHASTSAFTFGVAAKSCHRNRGNGDTPEGKPKSTHARAAWIS